MKVLMIRQNTATEEEYTLAPRRKARQVQREAMNYFAKSYSPFFSELCGLGVFARDIPRFDCNSATLGLVRLSPVKVPQRHYCNHKRE